MRYLETGQIIYINETQVGQGMVRDYELLEAAVMRPHQTVMGQDAYPTIHDKAAALTHSLMKNHPFMTPISARPYSRTSRSMDSMAISSERRGRTSSTSSWISRAARSRVSRILPGPPEHWTYEVRGDF